VSISISEKSASNLSLLLAKYFRIKILSSWGVGISDRSCRWKVPRLVHYHTVTINFFPSPVHHALMHGIILQVQYCEVEIFYPWIIIGHVNISGTSNGTHVCIINSNLNLKIISILVMSTIHPSANSKTKFVTIQLQKCTTHTYVYNGMSSSVPNILHG
jgi:hypothetical protein